MECVTRLILKILFGMYLMWAAAIIRERAIHLRGTNFAIIAFRSAKIGDTPYRRKHKYHFGIQNSDAKNLENFPLYC